MVKIEQFLGTVKAVYTKDGVEQPVFLHQIMSDRDFSTIKLTGNGSLLYSIDESQIGTLEVNDTDTKPPVSGTENTGYVPPKPVPPAAKPASKTVTKPKAGKAT